MPKTNTLSNAEYQIRKIQIQMERLSKQSMAQATLVLRYPRYVEEVENVDKFWDHVNAVVGERSNRR